MEQEKAGAFFNKFLRCHLAGLGRCDYGLSNGGIHLIVNYLVSNET
jgi:hypothetical protein